MKTSIRGKIIAVCASLLSVVALTACLGLLDLKSSRQRPTRVVEANAAAGRFVVQARMIISKLRRAMRDLLLARGGDERRVAGEIDQRADDRDDALRELGAPASGSPRAIRSPATTTTCRSSCARSRRRRPTSARRRCMLARAARSATACSPSLHAQAELGAAERR